MASLPLLFELSASSVVLYGHEDAFTGGTTRERYAYNFLGKYYNVQEAFERAEAPIKGPSLLFKNNLSQSYFILVSKSLGRTGPSLHFSTKL